MTETGQAERPGDSGMRNWILLAIALLAAPVSRAEKSIAFYYADEVPVHLLTHFDRIVVEADHLDTAGLEVLQQEGRVALAYVSIGEVGAYRPWVAEIPREWRLGTNPAWNSIIMDLSRPEWRDYLFEKRFRPLWESGYRGFFLDTLDSHLAVLTSEEARARQESGLLELLRRLRREYPEAVVYVNRGFDVVASEPGLVDGVVAESLHRRWNPAERIYEAVPPQDREWLTHKLRELKSRNPNLEIVVLDYLPPAERQEARQLAARIREDGFVPWISTPEQDMLGIGLVEVLPREILMLYDGSQVDGGELSQAEIFTMAGVPVEYLGYVPVYRDVRRGLPDETLRGRYAGVIIWLHDRVSGVAMDVWIRKLLDEGVPFLMFGNPGEILESGTLQRMGLKRIESYGTGPWSIVTRDGMIGFEIQPPEFAEGHAGFLTIGENENIRVHLAVRDAGGRRHDAILTADWGGIAADPWVVDVRLDGRMRWIVDPFGLIRKALQLEDLPMPDVTTINGRRIWLNHIDGDAFISKAEFPGAPWAAEVIRDRILSKFAYPHTVSVVEGEIGPHGIRPKDSPELERIARSLFSLPHVEPASHTYSHPFVWERQNGQMEKGYTLPIPDYKMDPEREIIGSMEYVNRLLPEGKACRILLWTGDALPGSEVLRIVDQAGAMNMNGGDTVIRRDCPFLSCVSPMARPVGSYLQVYAPIMNENVYTNNWRGPFYGYRRVTETFQMTDHPRRLKPLDIYYHFYSGTKPASLRALEDVYAWVESQETFPLHVSEYIPLVHEFRNISIAARTDGRLQYRGMKKTRSLRMFGREIDMAHSRGVAGWRKLHDAIYLHLASDAPLISIGGNQEYKPEGVMLHQANGHLEEWRLSGAKVSLRVQAHVPLMIEFKTSGSSCQLKANSGRVIKRKAVNNLVRFEFRKAKAFDGSLTCK